MDISKTIKAKMDEIRTRFKVGKLGVFGSFADGGEKEDSDVDILVEFTEPVDFFLFLDLRDFLENVLGKKVDLVTPGALKPLMKDYILSRVIYL